MKDIIRGVKNLQIHNSIFYFNIFFQRWQLCRKSINVEKIISHENWNCDTIQILL